MNVRMALFLLLTLGGCATTSVAPPPGPDPLRSQQLREVLEAHNSTVRAPAWAAAVVRDGHVIALAGIGVRNKESGEALDVETSLLHWGSLTKSVTATMLAGLVERGTLSWSTTLAQAFPDMPMLESYRGVTLSQLMTHRADLPPYTLLGPAQARQFASYTGTAVQRRDSFVRDVLQEAPPVQTGSQLVYSNAGPAVAAHVAEVATGRSWEDLVRTEVFERIGMSSAGFGLPAASSPAQTRGHAGPGPDILTVMGVGPTPGSPLMDAAGNIHSTVMDLAQYARAHLLGLQGKRGPLSVESVRELHTPPDDNRTLGPEGNQYAMGWGLRHEGQETVHWHNGSAGQFFAQVDLYPQSDLAIVVMTNAGFPGRGTPELVKKIRALY